MLYKINGSVVHLLGLPYLTSAPTVDASFGDPNQVSISWDPWSSDSGNGEGPVDRYIVYYRYASDVDAAYIFSESAGTSNSLVINGLNIDTEYDFVVVVARAGVGGAGRPSSKTTVRTECGSKNFNLEIDEMIVTEFIIIGGHRGIYNLWVKIENW